MATRKVSSVSTTSVVKNTDGSFTRSTTSVSKTRNVSFKMITSFVFMFFLAIVYMKYVKPVVFTFDNYNDINFLRSTKTIGSVTFDFIISLVSTLGNVSEKLFTMFNDIYSNFIDAVIELFMGIIDLGMPIIQFLGRGLKNILEPLSFVLNTIANGINKILGFFRLGG